MAAVQASSKIDNQSLYICSIEYNHLNEAAYVIHTMKLRDLLSCSCTNPNPTTRCHSCSSKPKGDGSELRQVAYMADEDNLPLSVGCGLFGSKILFGGGRKSTPDPHPRYPNRFPGRSKEVPTKEIYVFETDTTVDPDPKIEGQKFESFQAGKSGPLLVEMLGKLYALASPPTKFCEEPYFEVYDPADGKWSPLPSPPFLSGLLQYSDPAAQHFSYAFSRTCIIVSTQNRSRHYKFDICSRTWTLISPPFMFEGRPFPYRRQALTVLDVYDGGAHCLLFTYQWRQTSPIVVYLMHSDAMETIKALKLPDYHGEFPLDIFRPCQYSFVNLGGRKICLVMACFMRAEYCEWMGENEAEFMRFYVITLEFSKRDSDSKWDVEILSSRIFDNHVKRERSRILSASLLGCFLPVSSLANIIVRRTSQPRRLHHLRNIHIYYSQEVFVYIMLHL